MGLTDTGDKAVKHYSGGTRRRLDLAVTLLLTPALQQAGIEVDDIGLRRPTLDDVFLTLTRRKADDGPDRDAAGDDRAGEARDDADAGVAA